MGSGVGGGAVDGDRDVGGVAADDHGVPLAEGVLDIVGVAHDAAALLADVGVSDLDRLAELPEVAGAACFELRLETLGPDAQLAGSRGVQEHSAVAALRARRPAVDDGQLIVAIGLLRPEVTSRAALADDDPVLDRPDIAHVGVLVGELKVPVAEVLAVEESELRGLGDLSACCAQDVVVRERAVRAALCEVGLSAAARDEEAKEREGVEVFHGKEVRLSGSNGSRACRLTDHARKLSSLVMRVSSFSLRGLLAGSLGALLQSGRADRSRDDWGQPRRR